MNDFEQMSDEELMAFIRAEEAKAPAAPKPRPEFGPNAVELPNGEIWRTRRDGGLADRISGGTNADGTDPMAPKADAAQRGRIQFALDPLISAQQNLALIERGAPDPQRPGSFVPRNPFSSGSYGPGKPIKNFFDAMGNTFARNTMQSAGARPDSGPWAQTLAINVGGEDFQAANQAYSEFESALIPMFAGAAVTVTEAQRFLRANVPMPGENPRIVAQKMRARKQLANAAARISGNDIPFPDAPTVWPLSAQAEAEMRAAIGAPAQAPAQPQRSPQTPAARPPAPAQPQARQGAQRPAQGQGRQSRWTPAQQRFVASIRGGARGARGSATNPVLIRDEADFRALRPGQVFVDPDGERGVK